MTDGTCKGLQYSDAYGSWIDVIVQAIIKIMLMSSVVQVKVSTGKITLHSCTVCQIGDGHFPDIENEYTFRDVIPANRGCDFFAYDVLHKGWADKTRNLKDKFAPEIYLLTTNDITIELARTTEARL
ncbi:hypothetical protein M0804_013813 [Polistes exclamans]|nr:hypothetical protein M0804_013813 [Polistes exclamans]